MVPKFLLFFAIFWIFTREIPYSRSFSPARVYFLRPPACSICHVTGSIRYCRSRVVLGEKPLACFTEFTQNIHDFAVIRKIDKPIRQLPNMMHHVNTSRGDKIPTPQKVEQWTAFWGVSLVNIFAHLPVEKGRSFRLPKPSSQSPGTFSHKHGLAVAPLHFRRSAGLPGRRAVGGAGVPELSRPSRCRSRSQRVAACDFASVVSPPRWLCHGTETLR